MKSRILIFALGLFVVGGLAGWLVAPSPNGAAKFRPSDLPTATKSSRSLTNSTRSVGRVPGEARMRAIRDSQNERDRLLAAIALAKSLPLNKAGQWLDEGLFSQREGFALTLFTRILEKRWRTTDPDGYLVWQLGKGRSVSKEEMARLCERNPDLLLASIRLMRDPEARGQAFANLAKARPDLALAELAKMNAAELSGTGNFRAIFKEMAIADLATLQSAVEELPFNLQSEAQKAIYGQLLADDFSGTLPRLIELPNGMEIFLSNFASVSENRETFLSNFASLPDGWQRYLESETGYLTNGMEYAELLSTDWESYGISEKSAGEMRGKALFSKARGDQSGALALFQSANLNEAGRRYFLDMLSWNYGQDLIETLMPVLEASDQKYIVGKMESRSKFQFRGPSVTTAAEVSAEVTKGGLGREATLRLSNTMVNWSAEQKNKFREDYAAMEGEERLRVTGILAGGTGIKDLEIQVAAMNELPASPEAQEAVGWNEDQKLISIAGLAVSMLLQDTDRATKWVEDLPESETRTSAMKNMAMNWKNYDPLAAGKWIDSLPETTREDVRAFLKNPGN